MVTHALTDSRQAAGASAHRTRARLLRSLARDVATLLLAFALAAAFATAYLLLRTDRGRLDVSAFDATIAFAVLASSAPAWTAWRIVRTPSPLAWPDGHANAQAVVTRGVLVLLHPCVIPSLFWLAGLLALMEVPVAWLLTLAVAGITTALGLTSLLTMLVRPTATPLHLRVARRRAPTSSRQL